MWRSKRRKAHVGTMDGRKPVGGHTGAATVGRMGVPTFWCEPTGSEAVWLRRYTSTRAGEAWTCEAGWHAAKVRIEDAPNTDEPMRDDDWMAHEADPRWPTVCDKGCGYAFTDDDTRQVFRGRIYQRVDTGATFPLRDAPEGALYDAHWMGRAGDDGITLAVVLPGGRTWFPDSRASNCTMPDDDVHRCWCRHGDPRTAPVTVDKNCATCTAGAGSIGVDNWHGFLRDGQLVT